MTARKESIDSSATASFIRGMRQKPQQRGTRDLSVLYPEILEFLQSDRRQLEACAAQAKPASSDDGTAYPKRRLRHYYAVEEFLLFAAKHYQATQLSDITPTMIVDFLERERLMLLRDGHRTKESFKNRPWHRVQELEKTELKLFFTRVKHAGVIQDNPVTPLIQAVSRIEPENLSSPNQAALRGFRSYLQRLADNKRLSPGTVELYLRNARILLHDAETRNAHDPSWPTDLGDLFSDPTFIYDWLNTLENRSVCAKSKKLARDSIENRLLAIRHLWLFLRSQGRASEAFYQDLKARFRDQDDTILLPGRAAKVIEALSEEEERRLFQCIEQHSSDPILALRDTAMIITALQTTVRLDGLNSMLIQNFRELKPGVFVVLVRIKRPARKTADNLQRITEDNMVWQDWYVSPGARHAIHKYLVATGRDWHSTGPVWLTNDGTRLSYKSQQAVIKGWLEVAGCTFTRPHVLRHTGVDRLMNRFNLSIPIVQAISQHATPFVLLQIYAKRAQTEAFEIVNQVFPQVEDDWGSCRDLILSIGARLNKVSAEISQRAQEKRTFTRAHAEELLGLLRRQIERLTQFLGYEATADVVVLPIDDYTRIGDTLQLAGLSYEKVLGYTPRAQVQTIIHPAGRKPKSLLGG